MTKRIECPNKYYSTFMPMERLNLLLAAIARDDDAEIDNLFNTCPRFKYIQTDAEFVGKYQSMTNAGMIFILHWEKYINTITMLRVDDVRTERQMHIFESVVETLELYEAEKAYIDEVQKEIERLHKYIAKIAEQGERQLVKMKSLIEAHRQFCNEIGLQEKTALQWLEVKGLEIISFPIPENVGIDEDFLRERKDDFYQCWKRYPSNRNG